MPASYPSSSKSFVTRIAGDTIAPSHINDLQAEVTAIETDLLGATPTFLATVTSGINASALSTGTVALSRLDANVLLTTSTTGINASALSTGTVPLARLDSNVILTTSTTGINASALSTGTVPLARLDSNVILTTSTTGINASALSTGTMPLARLDSNVILTTSSTGINASALSTGTVSLARLDSNVILTTSTTGINASALSTGTVPLARLDSNVILTTSTTGVNASALSTGTVPLARLSSANTTANGVVDTTTQTFAGDKTFQNTTSFSNTVSITGAANTLSTLGVTGTLSALGQLSVTGNATFDTTTLFVDATNDRVGIGTASPTSKLMVSGTSGVGSSDIGIYSTSANYGYSIRVTSASRFALQDLNTSTDRLTVDSSGNVGIGVTPSAWGSGSRGLDIGSGSDISAVNAPSDYLALLANAYFDGSNWKYNKSTTASRYILAAGQHLWYSAPSGTAGNTITFTERMRLGLDGDLAIGATARFFLDGVASVGDTYITESSANVMDFYAGGINTVRANSSGVAVTGTGTFSSTLGPSTNDGAALGSGSVAWADLFLASGGVVNFNNGDVTVTHSANTLTFGGASSGYVLNDGVLNVNAFGSYTFGAGGTGSGTNAVLIADSGTGMDSGSGFILRKNSLTKGGIVTRSNFAGGTSDATTVFSQVSAGLELIANDASGDVRIYSRNALAATFGASQAATLTGTLAWGGGSAISSSSNVALTNSVQTWANASGNGWIQSAASWILMIDSDNNSSGEGFYFRKDASGSGGTDLFSILENGNVSINATAKLYLDGGGDTYMHESSSNLVYGYAGGAAIFAFTNSGGNFFMPGGDNSVGLGNAGHRWTAVFAVNGTIQTSDRTRKHDISTDTLGLDFISKLRPVSFTMNDEVEGTRRHGLIAQEVIEAAAGQSLLGILTGDIEGDYGLNYAGFVPALIAAIQQQQVEINALKAQLTRRQ